MSQKRRIFISSVQKELELERAAVAGLISTDPFFIQHCEAVLFEKEPPPPQPAKQPYLNCRRGCSVYVLILANEYGQPDGDLSATHHEYRLAQQIKLPTVVFIEGMSDADKVRSAEVRDFIAEIKNDGYTYKRFHDRDDLKPEMLRALMRTLNDAFGIKATTAEIDEGNAVAHRSYDDSSRKVFVRVFSDRVEVSSPGYPPQLSTLAKLRRGGYRPFSRNRLIAQTLATLGVMEQRGSGFARMREAMLNHGLDEAKITQEDGFFVVTLPGPAGDYDRIKAPAAVAGPVTPAIEAQLNDRQKLIFAHVLSAGMVTRGWCVTEFKVANDTAGRDLKALTELGLLEIQGKGRAARYVVKTTGNRQAKS